MGWSFGEPVVRREMLRTGPWLGAMVRIVRDDADALVSYMQEGTRFGFPPGPWPSADGLHPWHGKTAWRGHGVLMVQRPGEAHAIWHFWSGPEREFAGWYINLQEPFVRTPLGYDTQDLELDIWVRTDGSWSFKDRELMPQRIAEGRWTEQEVEAICADGDRLAERLARGERWWDERWAQWEPDPSWQPVPLPDGWDRV